MSTMKREALLPQRTRTYKNHALDSTAWDYYQPRAGDVIITTALKAGTTWMQTIVGNLIFQDDEMPCPLWQLTPWLDSRAGSREEKLRCIEAQTHVIDAARQEQDGDDRGDPGAVGHQPPGNLEAADRGGLVRYHDDREPTHFLFCSLDSPARGAGPPRRRARPLTREG